MMNATTNPNEVFRNWSEMCNCGMEMARKFAQENMNFVSELSNQFMKYSQHNMELVKQATQQYATVCTAHGKKDSK